MQIGSAFRALDILFALACDLRDRDARWILHRASQHIQDQIPRETLEYWRKAVLSETTQEGER